MTKLFVFQAHLYSLLENPAKIPLLATLETTGCMLTKNILMRILILAITIVVLLTLQCESYALNFLCVADDV